jgi:hypothetical protein
MLFQAKYQQFFEAKIFINRTRKFNSIKNFSNELQIIHYSENYVRKDTKL